MNGEGDLLRSSIGRFNIELDPATIVLKLRRIGAQAPFLGDGRRAAAAGQGNRPRARRVATVTPQKRVGQCCWFGADHTPVKLEIDGARTRILKITGKLSIGPERPSADADTCVSGACYRDDDSQRENKPECRVPLSSIGFQTGIWFHADSVHANPPFIPKVINVCYRPVTYTRSPLNARCS